ncbi:MAG TPA: chemotaxis protein CheX [Candidatus Sulfotelmatobacter sp.]|nr:chemotaxis protein CheX [Candidatus Sulfotelmatobacter sp.]
MTTTTNHLSQLVPPDPHWKGILECAAIEVFSMMAGVTLTTFEQPPAEPHGDRTAMVGLAGPLCGMITIRCTSPAAAKLANQMLGEDAASNPSVMADAMGELCNMVAGNFKSKITNLADNCLLSVPTVIWGEDYVVQTIAPNEGFQVALSLEGEAVWFTLVIHT